MQIYATLVYKRCNLLYKIYIWWLCNITRNSCKHYCIKTSWFSPIKKKLKVFCYKLFYYIKNHDNSHCVDVCILGIVKHRCRKTRFKTGRSTMLCLLLQTDDLLNGIKGIRPTSFHSNAFLRYTDNITKVHNLGMCVSLLISHEPQIFWRNLCTLGRDSLLGDRGLPRDTECYFHSTECYFQFKVS